MARRRKTEIKVPMKQQAKSSVRKSTRQKAKKQQLEDEKVNGCNTCENANNSENLKDSNDTNGKEPPSQVDHQVDVSNKLEVHERCENKDILDKNSDNNADKPNYTNYSPVNMASIGKFEFLHGQPTIVNENSPNEAVCPEDVVEETTIYEEMEIETESTVDNSIISHNNIIKQILFVNESKLEETNTLKCLEMENKISSNSMTVSSDHIEKSLSTNINSEYANSDSYQMIEKGLSGLHMAESEIHDSSKELDNLDSELNISRSESRKITRNARAKKFTSALMNSIKKDNEHRKKKKSDKSIEQNYNSTDDSSFDTESKEKVIETEESWLAKEKNKHNVKIVDENLSKKNKPVSLLSDEVESKIEFIAQNNRTLVIKDILSENLSEKELEHDKADEKLMNDKQVLEQPKSTVTEEHSIDSETNRKMDFEDIKLSSSSESSSDTLLSKTCVHLNSTNELNEQCEINERTETKNKNEDNEPTKLESGSNNSGVRRSNRIKHIGLRKQRSRGRGLVIKPFQESQKVYVCSEREKLTSSTAIEPEEHVIQITKFETQIDKESIKCTIVPQDNLNSVTSNTSVTNCDSDSNKPVKVKSRWRRSSELEMGNSTSWSALQSNVTVSFAGTDTSIENRFSLLNNSINKELNDDTESLQVPQVFSEQESNTTIPLEDNVTIKISTSALSNDLLSNVSTAAVPNTVGAKICLPMVPEIDREMEERLSQFEHLKENLYLTDRYTNKETKRMVCDCFLTEEEIQRGELGCGEDCLNRLLMIECGSRCVVGNRCTNKRFQNCNYAKCEVFRTEKKGFGLRATANMNAGEFIMEYVGEVVDSRDFRRRAKEYSKDKNRHYYFMALKSDQIIDATMKGNISRFINHSCDPNAETQKWTVNGELRIGFFNKKFVAAGEEITFDYHFQRYGKEAQKCFCEAANCRGWIGDNPEDGKSSVECMEDTEMDTEDESEDEEEQEDVEVKPEKQVRKSKREEKKISDHMEDEDLEEQIDRLCASGLKNRSHTLTLSRLMVRCRELQHRRRLLEVIQSGEQPCRRLFLDYHGLRLMWSYMMDVAGSETGEAQQFRLEIVKTLMTLPIPNRTMLIDSKVLSVVEKWSKQLYHSPSGDSPDDEQSKLKLSSAGEEAEVKEADDKDDPEAKKALSGEQALIAEVAGNLLESWSNLKEVFRIPKKERLEQMKEHEREADRGYKEDAEKEAARETLSYERHRSERYRGGVGQGVEADKQRPDGKRANLVQVPRMSKFERRQLFALKVAKEEEERQRRQQQELWQQHQAQCLALGVDPCTTAALDPQSGYPLFFESQLAQWQAELARTDSPLLRLYSSEQQCPLAPLPANVARPPEGPLHQQPHQQQQQPADSEQPPPALDLPPKWKWARDKRGRVYYYHARERLSQWLPPPPDHIGLQPDSGPDSSSDETSDDESISSRDNDEDDDNDAAATATATAAPTPTPEDDAEAETNANERDEPDSELEPDEQLLPDEHPPCLDATDPEPPPPSKHPADHRKRRDGLVQERIISPRREEDRVDHSKFKELKDKLRRQKEKSRLKDHLQSEKTRKHRRSAKSKSHVKQSQLKSFQTITSDMSPTTERKIKDTFRINMAQVMVPFLNPYRKTDCKQGRITNTEDFKYLARKLTHFVLAKELKHCKSVDELECNDNVKHKAKDFVRKYMNKFGAVYQRDKDED